MEGNKDMKNTQETSRLYMILGVIIILVVGFLGVKLLVSTKNYKLSLVDAPKEMSVGKPATFTWRIDGSPATIKHTGVHYGLVSNPGELTVKTLPADTKYTEMVKDFAEGEFNIPLQFVGNAYVSQTGTYYFRVHATIEDKNYWTDEYTFEVKTEDYSISIINAPKEAMIDQVTTFTWRVDGPPTSISHTSIHFGTESTPGDFGRDISPGDTSYNDLIKDFADGTYNIPLQFVGNHMIATAGSYFYRGHAVIDGKNYWTDEYTFEIK